MGNLGKSSSGCSLCRKRKIKCDEGKPGCRRCAQIHKPCPGYRYQVQLQIIPSRTSLETALPEPERSVGSNSLQTYDAWALGGHIKAQDHSSKLLVQRAGYGQHSISHPPRYDIQHQSLCFFLNLFCFQAGRLYSFPVLDFLPDLIQKSEPDSGIYQAATAVSRLTLADRYSGRDIRLQTGREYGRALSVTKAAIRNSVAPIQDETVLAVWLLGLYEHISVLLSHGRRSVDSKNADEEWLSHLSHVRGALRLLRLRGMSQFTNRRSEKIFRIFKAAIQMRLLILTPITYKDFDELDIDVFKEEHEFVPSQTANRATAYFHRVARLLEKIRGVLAQHTASRPPKTSSGKELLNYGESLDEGMVDWSKDEPGWDILHVQSGTAGTMWSLYPSHAQFYFYSFWVYLYWIRFLSARVKLYEGLIELQNVLNARQRDAMEAELKIAGYRNMIQITASELVGLTAYALGDVTPLGSFNSSISGRNPGRGFQEVNVVAAMQLVIPLKMLQRSEYPTAAQKGAVDLALVHIGDGFKRQPIIMA